MSTIEDKFAFGLMESPTDDDIAEFGEYSLNLYRDKNWTGETLSEVFYDDFESFTEAMFAKIPKVIRVELRDYLRQNNVYVPKRRGLKIPEALFKTITENPQWPLDDTDRPGPVSQGVEATVQVNLPAAASTSPRTDQFGTAHGNSTRNNPASFRTTGSSTSADYAVNSVGKAYYHASDKYSGSFDDNLERKLSIFDERCEQSGVAREDKRRAFSYMLSDVALQYYLDVIKPSTRSYPEIIVSLRKRFLTKERTLSLTREWEKINLKDFMSKNSDKTPKESLSLMISRIQELQGCLPHGFRKDDILMNKLLNACEGVESCRLARQKPASTVEGIIADLYTSISTYQSPDLQIPSANLVDRHRRGPTNSNKKCFVCKRTGCWSTKHTREERMRSLRKKKSFQAMMAELDENAVPADDLEEILQNFESAAAFLTEGHEEKNTPTESDDTTPGCHITFCSDAKTSSELFSYLSESATMHALTTKTLHPARYTPEHFYGIMIDTGCSYASTSGHAQYQAYCKYTGASPNIDKERSSTVMFGKGSVTSTGVARITMPFRSMLISFDIHVLENTDVPILLSLHDMDKLGIYFNNLVNLLVQPSSQNSVPVQRRYGHPFYKWCNITSCMYTKNELNRLHRRFGHPSADKLYNLLKRANLNDLPEGTRATLEKISKYCRLCQFHAQRPRRFKFTLRTEKDFNQSVFVDLATIDKKICLHVVCEGTRYQAARWLPRTTASDVWRAFRLCWIDVYLGPPDIVVHDAGTNLIAKSFQTNNALMYINTKAVPIESANSMTYVERYHVPLRRAYKIMKDEAPGLDDEALLQCAVKSVNDSVGPDGLVPTLLVYGALPRLGLKTEKPTATTQQRATAVRNATAEMSRYFAKRQVREALNQRNGPNVLDIHKAELGSHVLVYRIANCSWAGPYKLLNRDGETCTLLTNDGPKSFRTTACKPYHVDPDASPNPSIGTKVEVFWPKDKKYYPGTISEYFTDSNKYKIKYDDGEIEILDLKKENWRIISNENTPAANIASIRSYLSALHASSVPTNEFTNSRKKELDGLLAQGVFLPVPKSESYGHRIFGCRFVDKIKNTGTPEAYAKSRLVVQGYNDKADGLLTHAPTVQRSSQKLLFALAPSFPTWKVATRDVTQAYTQSTSPLSRKIFVRAPKELELPDDMVLSLQCPLYGVPEAGVHWFWTYLKHHKEKLGMRSAAHDMCLLYTPGSISTSSQSKEITDAPRAITCLQTDDTASLANTKFLEDEQKHASAFKSNPLEILQDGKSMKFNGAVLSKLQNRYSLTAPSHVSKMKVIEKEIASKEEYVSQRARGAYIASVCRPDLSFRFSYAAQFLDPQEPDFKMLNKAITCCVETDTGGLKYIPLDLNSLHMAVFIDASFAGNSDYTSQLGFVACLMDNEGNSNIVHYGSSKSKRVTRSVLSAELYAMVYGFDNCSVIHHALQEFLGRTVEFKIYTDSKSLFDSLVTLNSTTEKRLLIDLTMLRECYEKRDITEVLWIPGDQNPADAMTKDKACKALSDLMATNKIQVDPKGWIERNPPKPNLYK